MARQTRAAVAAEFWDVYNQIRAKTVDPLGMATGGFYQCPNGSQGNRDNSVIYGIWTQLTPGKSTLQTPAGSGNAQALPQEVEPTLHSHGWSRWQSKTGSVAALGPGTSTYVESDNDGYDLIFPPSDGASITLLLTGPCVTVGVPEATALTTATQDQKYRDTIFTDTGAEPAPTSSLPTP